jgi:NADH-quinone oxidoreductase subunit J
MLGHEIGFYLISVAAVASALGVVLSRNAVYSMLSLIVNLLCLALFFLLLDAIFLATVQVLIYAGAVMVLFLFVVTMLAPDERDTGPANDRQSRLRLRFQWGAGAGLAVILAGSLIFAFVSGAISRDAQAAGASGLAQHVNDPKLGNIEAFGLALFHGFSLPFEITSALLVVAVLGAVVLGRRASKS